MGRLRLCGLALAAVAVLFITTVYAQNDRLVEKEIHLPLDPRFVSETPLVDPPKRIAGYFKLNRTHDARMFYFFFQSRNSPKTDPVVLWMTGGPGCSSEIAIFFENGPYSINNDTRTLTETQYGWDTLHNMIFVDQPIGTGFSYSQDWRDRVYNEQLVGDDMLDFLYAFYQAHPDLLDNDFFVTGESYAGHYVPAVSSAIYRANELGQGPITIPLRGLAIGNGMTNPAVQFPAYADFALQNKLISQGLHDSIGWWMPLCTWGADFCDTHQWRFACVLALQVCQMVSFQRILAANPDINVYDITKTCDGPLCYDMSAADEFLNRPDVRQELGVGNREWEECNMAVNGDFMGDWLRSYDKLLPAMLDDGIRVMIYAGDLDLICNWVGNERWVDMLEWEQSGDWPAAAAEEWAAQGSAAGTVRAVGPLSFVRVYQAGHMVPMDQPAAALQMITLFTRDKPLTTPVQQLESPLRSRLEGAGQLAQEARAAEVEAARLTAKARRADGFSSAQRQETYRRDKYGDGEGGGVEGAGAEVEEVVGGEAEELGAKVQLLKEVLGRHQIGHHQA